jgi:WXG100 family type VII secretion target
MSAPIVQARYEELEQIAARFAAAAEQQQALQERVSRQVEVLRSGGWQGRGVAAFLREMDGEVGPASVRLTESLTRAADVTLQVNSVMRLSEEEAARPFRDDARDDGRDFAGKKGKLDEKSRISGFERSNDKLFVQGQGDTRSIHPNDVAQGAIGDCFFVTSLAAVASQNPDFLRRAIKQNTDGTYTVTFYKKHEGFLGIGAKYEPVHITVSPEFPKREVFDKETGKWVPDANRPHSGTGDQELWPRLIEKAYAQWIGYGNATRGYQELNEGGYPRNVLTALTGVDSKSTGSMGKYNIDELAKLQQNGAAITLSSMSKNESGKAGFYPAGTGQIHTNHAYWVESIDAKNNKIVVRNPWGYQSDNQYRIELTYEEFKKSFDRIDVNTLKR